jgi:hypothetical protein
MTAEINSHVTRLRRFQPFQPDSAELIYEQSDPREPGFEMVALDHLATVVEQAGVRVVVLTGDAGHGKTSLCARLLERLGADALQAADLLRDLGDGAKATATTRTGQPLRILKDLSDVTVERGTALLLELLDLADETVSIVCANEGRLRRAVAADATGRLQVFSRTLEHGMADGSLGGVDDSVQVVNLNYQSVAPDQRRGLVDWAMRSWGADRRRWQICARCDASSVCPIYANHRLLADEAAGDARRDGVRALFATAERSGAVVTTRQALAAIAHAVTGGLQCSDVHRRRQRGFEDTSWQHRHLFHQALFADKLSRSQRAHVPAIDGLRRLDPGAVALRSVDDTLEPTDGDPPFLPAVPALDEGTPRSRREAQRESETLRQLMRFLRRREFFEPTSSATRLERMGLQAGEAFQAAVEAAGTDAVTTRDRLLRGLEAVQGVHRAGQPPDFLLLDPAFVTHRSRAAVVAKRVQSRGVRVVSQTEHWRIARGSTPELTEAMDWLDRVVYLRIENGQPGVALPIDLLRFELLYRWAAGLSSRSHYEAEIRHLSGALSTLVPVGDVGDEITVLVGGERRTLTIDVGEQIRSGEG